MTVAVPDSVWQFLDEYIDDVPQLEAVLLMWQDPRRPWSAQDVAGCLHVPHFYAIGLMENLKARKLVQGDFEQGFEYSPEWDTANVMQQVAEAYRQFLIPVATYLHGRNR